MNFQWKKYSKFSIACNSFLKNFKSPSLNPILQGLSNNMKRAPKFPDNFLKNLNKFLMKDCSTFNNYQTNSMHPCSLRAFQWYQEWKEKLAKQTNYLPSYINDTRVFLRNFVCTQSDDHSKDVRKVVIILKKIDLNIAINQIWNTNP